jgi:hypothetical protein
LRHATRRRRSRKLLAALHVKRLGLRGGALARVDFAPYLVAAAYNLVQLARLTTPTAAY